MSKWGRMNKQIWMVAVSAGALMLSGCGGEQPQKDAANTEIEKLATERNTKPAQAENEISASIDQEELARYGACLAIMTSMNNIINNQSAGNDPRFERDPGFEIVRSVNAHRAAIYRLAILEIVNSAPASSQEKLLKISNQFLRDNILNQEVSMNDLISFKNEMCYADDMTELDANRLLSEYSDDYESEKERVFNILL